MTSDATPAPSADQPHTDDPSAGLSATGRTADQMQVDDGKPGTDYGSVGSIGGDDQESAASDGRGAAD